MVISQTSGQRISTKGYFAAGRFFMVDNVMWHRPVGTLAVGCIEDWVISFVVYTTTETSNTFQWVGQPPKLPLPIGIFLTPI